MWSPHPEVLQSSVAGMARAVECAAAAMSAAHFQVARLLGRDGEGEDISSEVAAIDSRVGTVVMELRAAVTHLTPVAEMAGTSTAERQSFATPEVSPAKSSGETSRSEQAWEAKYNKLKAKAHRHSERAAAKVAALEAELAVARRVAGFTIDELVRRVPFVRASLKLAPTGVVAVARDPDAPSPTRSGAIGGIDEVFDVGVPSSAIADAVVGHIVTSYLNDAPAVVLVFGSRGTGRASVFFSIVDRFVERIAALEHDIRAAAGDGVAAGSGRTPLIDCCVCDDDVTHTLASTMTGHISTTVSKTSLGVAIRERQLAYPGAQVVMQIRPLQREAACIIVDIPTGEGDTSTMDFVSLVAAARLSRGHAASGGFSAGLSGAGGSRGSGGGDGGGGAVGESTEAQHFESTNPLFSLLMPHVCHRRALLHVVGVVKAASSGAPVDRGAQDDPTTQLIVKMRQHGNRR